MTKREARPGSRTTRSLKPPPVSHGAPDARLDLATELYGILQEALQRFGIDSAEQATAFATAQQAPARQNASGAIAQDMRGLADLLSEWSRAPAYLDRDGQPRVLAVTGPGSTFETLAARFLPSRALPDVVALACAAAEVALRPKGRIALLGSILVNTTLSRQHLLAHAVRHIDQLLQTILHNAEVHRGLPRRASGRMERMVLGLIKRERVADLMVELRPQLYDILLRVDSSVEQRRPLTAAELNDATAVSVGIYVSEEPNAARAGIDLRTVLPPGTDER